VTARANNAEYLRELRAAAAAKGLCYVCRCRPRKLGRKSCQDCLDRVYAAKAGNRAKWQKQGLCVLCGQKRAAGVVHCSRCRDRLNAAGAARYHDAAARKLCRRCRRVVVVDGTLCAGCVVVSAAATKAMRERRRAKGVCVRCDQPAAPGSTWMCLDHAEKQREYQRAWAERQQVAS
jgi:hypothetical protein